MRTKISSKLESLLSKLTIIEAIMKNEMDKHYTKRRQPLLEFLYKEKAMYQFAVTMLQEVLESENEHV